MKYEAECEVCTGFVGGEWTRRCYRYEMGKFGIFTVLGTFTSELDTKERVERLSQLYLDELRILVCTEVAARGIDANDVGHVIMYDFPEKYYLFIIFSATSFVHKSGRTGRMGGKGKVTSFIRDSDLRLVNELFPLIQQGEKIDEIFSSRGSFGRRKRRNPSSS